MTGRSSRIAARVLLHRALDRCPAKFASSRISTGAPWPRAAIATAGASPDSSAFAHRRGHPFRSLEPSHQVGRRSAAIGRRSRRADADVGATGREPHSLVTSANWRRATFSPVGEAHAADASGGVVDEGAAVDHVFFRHPGPTIATFRRRAPSATNRSSPVHRGSSRRPARRRVAAGALASNSAVSPAVPIRSAPLASSSPRVTAPHVLPILAATSFSIADERDEATTDGAAAACTGQRDHRYNAQASITWSPESSSPVSSDFILSRRTPSARPEARAGPVARAGARCASQHFSSTARRSSWPLALRVIGAGAGTARASPRPAGNSDAKNTSACQSNQQLPSHRHQIKLRAQVSALCQQRGGRFAPRTTVLSCRWPTAATRRSARAAAQTLLAQQRPARLAVHSSPTARQTRCAAHREQT